MSGIKSARMVLVAASVLVLTGTSLASTNYGVGFTWNRWDDWQPGTTNGSSEGNPGPDTAGNPVWSYEYYQGVPVGMDLGTSTPWYELQPSGRMVWTGDTTPEGSWGYQYYVPPFAYPGPYGILHLPKNGVSGGNGNHYSQVPLVRWDNPSSVPIEVSLVSGDGFQAIINELPTGTVADIIIARTDASDGDSVHLLYSQTITKTLTQSQKQYFALAPVNIENLQLDPGDDLLFSIRARNLWTGGGWYTTAFRDDVNITVVPEPTTLSLLVLCGLPLLRRRRKI